MGSVVSVKGFVPQKKALFVFLTLCLATEAGIILPKLATANPNTNQPPTCLYLDPLNPCSGPTEVVFPSLSCENYDGDKIRHCTWIETQASGCESYIDPDTGEINYENCSCEKHYHWAGVPTFLPCYSYPITKNGTGIYRNIVTSESCSDLQR